MLEIAGAVVNMCFSKVQKYEINVDRVIRISEKGAVDTIKRTDLLFAFRDFGRNHV
jgi:hypothetical protein